MLHTRSMSLESRSSSFLHSSSKEIGVSLVKGLPSVFGKGSDLSDWLLGAEGMDSEKLAV